MNTIYYEIKLGVSNIKQYLYIIITISVYWYNKNMLNIDYPIIYWIIDIYISVSIIIHGLEDLIEINIDGAVPTLPTLD